MIRLIALLSIIFSILVFSPGPSQAQQSDVDRSATGGAQTLEDILRRQKGEKVDSSFRRDNVGNPDSAAGISAQLGTLGGASDADTWRALRYGSVDIKVSSGGLPATVLMQDGGMRWLQFRQGPLVEYGAYLLGATIILLALFFAIRGRIKIDGELTGRKIVRFEAIERFAHWLLAGSFILLAISGLVVLFGRFGFIPLIGKDAYSVLALASKWVHNNVAWAFMLGLIMVLVLWIAHNLPDKTDIKWLLQGGGIFTKSHPPAKKFNAGQKLIFWSVIILGASVSASGLSLLFPFEMPMFAATFEKLNAFGISALLGLGALPEQLAPHEEMQFAQLWHTIVALVMIAIILAHIYIGSVGMEGAYDAMGSGEVEEQWAKEHHSLWVDELLEKERAGAISRSEPAE